MIRRAAANHARIWNTCTMAVRKFSIDRWIKAVASAHGKPAAAELNGLSPGGVASQLEISRQAVHQAVHRGDLDAIIVNDGNGKLRMFMITASSIERFKQKRARGERRRA